MKIANKHRMTHSWSCSGEQGVPSPVPALATAGSRLSHAIRVVGARHRSCGIEYLFALSHQKRNVSEVVTVSYYR